MTAKLVGVDSEWKMHINVKEKDKGPAVLQLASQSEAFLIDLHSLAKSKELDAKLSEIFTTQVIIGFSFQSDL